MLVQAGLWFSLLTFYQTTDDDNRLETCIFLVSPDSNGVTLFPDPVELAHRGPLSAASPQDTSYHRDDPATNPSFLPLVVANNLMLEGP